MKKSTVFSSIAEEFGIALKGTRGLRDLNNKKNMNNVKRYEPHELSEVLSGALYSVLNEIFMEIRKREIKESRGKEEVFHEAFSSTGRSLWTAARRLKRMVFRALDYLPPGEVSFADFGRAMIAVDHVAYPQHESMRNYVRSEFVRRSIVTDNSVLNVSTEFDDAILEGCDVPNLLSSDYAAYQFVNYNRSLFLIPEKEDEEEVQFEVRPRLHLKKKYDPDHPLTKEGEEYLFKVSWSKLEDIKLEGNYPKKRSITVGTTLALSWDKDKKKGKILTRLTSDPNYQKNQFVEEKFEALMKSETDELQKDRDGFLKHLVEDGYLKISDDECSEEEENLSLNRIEADVVNGILRLSNTGNFLHILEGGDE